MYTTVPSHILKARWKNALKKAARVNRLLKQGYIVWLNDDIVTQPFRIDNFNRKDYDHLLLGCVVYFINTPNLDNGAYDTIKEYNKNFVVKAVNPKHIKTYK